MKRGKQKFLEKILRDLQQTKTRIGFDPNLERAIWEIQMSDPAFAAATYKKLGQELKAAELRIDGHKNYTKTDQQFQEPALLVQGRHLQENEVPSTNLYFAHNIALRVFVSVFSQEIQELAQDSQASINIPFQLTIQPDLLHSPLYYIQDGEILVAHVACYQCMPLCFHSYSISISVVSDILPPKMEK